jgi:hypothetical protein
MRHSYHFSIDSDRSEHILFVNAHKIATFPTLDAAEAEATRIAQRAVPNATLPFQLDFKWTLSEIETRGASLQWESGNGSSHRDSAVNP